MRSLNVYLSGATKNVDKEFQNWRNRYMEFFDINLNFIDPIRYFNYTDKKPKTNKQCLDLFMWQIDNSDVLLVNLDYSEVSIGTAMEVEHAYCNNIPIIAFGEKDETWYSWIVERASVIFDSLEEALCYIDDYYYASTI